MQIVVKRIIASSQNLCSLYKYVVYVISITTGTPTVLIKTTGEYLSSMIECLVSYLYGRDGYCVIQWFVGTEILVLFL